MYKIEESIATIEIINLQHHSLFDFPHHIRLFLLSIANELEINKGNYQIVFGLIQVIPCMPQGTSNHVYDTSDLQIFIAINVLFAGIAGHTKKTITAPCRYPLGTADCAAA